MRVFLLFFLGAFSLLFSLNGVAQSTFNNATGDGNWTTAGNWSPVGVPATGVNVTISADCTYDEASVYPGGLYKTYAALTISANQTLTISGGDLVFNGQLILASSSKVIVDAKKLVDLEAWTFAQMQTTSAIDIINGGEFLISTGPFGVNSFLMNDAIITVGADCNFIFDVNGGNTTFQISNGSLITVERGGVFLIDAPTATLNFPTIGYEMRVKNGGTYAYSVSSVSGGTPIIFEAGSNFLEDVNNPFPRPEVSEFSFQLATQASGGWHQVGFPFSALSWSDAWGDLNPKVSTGNDHNIYYYDASDDGVGNAKGWVKVANQTDAVDPTKAYTIFTGGSNYPWISGGDVLIPLIGSLEIPQAEYTKNLEFTMDGNANSPTVGIDDGWNLIANPYPAYLDITDIITDIDFLPAYKSIHYWDAASANYIAYVNGVPIINSNNGLPAPPNGSGIYQDLIAPYQSFWVKSKSAGVSFKIKGSHREYAKLNSSNTVNSQLKKNPEVITLSVTDPLNRVHYMYWNHEIGADNEFGTKDAFARNPGVPQSPFFGDVTVNGAWAHINTLDASNFGTRTVGFSVAGADVYVWKLDTTTVAGLDHLYLKDLKTGTLTDLTASSYSFVNDPNYSDNRFEVSLTGTISIDEANALSNAFQDAYFAGEDLIILLDESKVQNISGSVTDMQGRVVARFTENANSKIEVPMQNLAPGIYVLTIQSNGQVLGQRKMMKM